MDEYLQFLNDKIAFAPSCGFDVALDEVHPWLKPHAREVVRWAVAGGRRALFEAYGLHKTSQQLAICDLILRKLGSGRALIICPLGVRQEFKRDAAQMSIETRFVRRTEEVTAGGIYLTNYESVRDGKLDVSLFQVVSLDEASVLRSFGSKTYQSFLQLFADVPYRFVATATPSPNRLKELIHYAGFLGVMDTGQALTRFFQRDSTKAGNLTLYPHKEREFWLWVHSWAVFLQRPSDLGFSDAGYDLPPLQVHLHEIPTRRVVGAMERSGQATMAVDAAMSLPTAAREKRDSLDDRVAKMAEIVAAGAPDDHWLLWHTLEDERHAIKAAIPDATCVWGTQGLDEREQAIIDFSDGKLRLLATKPEIAGSGCNFQRHCHKAIFLGVDDKANDLMQAVHRIQRFQQQHPCEVHIIYTEAERMTLQRTMAKWRAHEEMQQDMAALIREHGLSTTETAKLLQRTIGVDRREATGRMFRVANNDAVLEARLRPDASLGLIVTSIPFSNHYEYCASYNDMGHTRDNGHFWAQMDFLTPELLRALKPGRLACIHVKDRILFGNVTGFGRPTVSPFHAEAIFHYLKHGFLYQGMITVVTDVVRENNQTYRLGFSENAKDSTKMGVGSPEYVLLFARPQSDLSRGYADEPVTKVMPRCSGAGGEAVAWSRERKPIPGDGYSIARWQIDAHAFWRSSGQRIATAQELAALGPEQLTALYTRLSLDGAYDYEFHVRLGEEMAAKGCLPSTFMSLAPGSPNQDVWHDVDRMRTLNGEQAAKGREMHICPLQFDIVDRLIERYSNPGDVVYDPFGGLMTVPVRAILKGRNGGASELNPGYFDDGLRYLRAAEEQVSMPTLFDLMDAEQIVEVAA